MNARYNNAFGEWLARAMEERNITSSRQAQIRAQVAHTTIEDIVRGRRPSVETAIRIAQGFGESIPAALRLAGYDDIAELWEKGAAPSGLPDSSSLVREERGSYTDPPWILRYHDPELSEDVRARIDAMIEALFDAEERLRNREQPRKRAKVRN